MRYKSTTLYKYGIYLTITWKKFQVNPKFQIGLFQCKCADGYEEVNGECEFKPKPYEYWLTTGFDAVGGDLINFDDVDTLDECIEKCNMHFDCSVKDSK